MIANQKSKFNLMDGHTYLNCATMSPQLKTVEAIGSHHLERKSNPYEITTSDFFTDRALLKERFSELVSAEGPEHVAIIPSVSYGMANAMKNVHFEPGDEVLLTEAQFPSNYYGWKALEAEKKIRIVIVNAPEIKPGRGEQWNQRILEAINARTKVVSVPQVHWADGTYFDLKAIRERTREVNALLIIDGTQSVGALPFSVRDIQPDALICGGYKWLMGAYGLGMAYFGEYFFEGRPIENNWINHQGSEDFSRLVHYNNEFKPGAARYDMGESSTFILAPMLSEGIRQIIEWTPLAIQNYCEQLTAPFLSRLKDQGLFIEDNNGRKNHLFGIYGAKDLEKVKARLNEKQVHVSFRGNAIRVSPHLYNSEEDLEKLVSCFI